MSILTAKTNVCLPAWRCNIKTPAFNTFAQSAGAIDMRPGPTTQRVKLICDHMVSLGAYTQADEITQLCQERDALKEIVVALLNGPPKLPGDALGSINFGAVTLAE